MFKKDNDDATSNGGSVMMRVDNKAHVFDDVTSQGSAMVRLPNHNNVFDDVSSQAESTIFKVDDNNQKKIFKLDSEASDAVVKQTDVFPDDDSEVKFG